MINIIIKNKSSIKGPAQYRRRKPSGPGFVILFAVTISAILLSIALGVSNIALKEVKFGTNARDTNDAFFAADTGVEQVLFLDKDGGICGSIPCNYASFFSQLGSAQQSCVIVTVNKTPELTTVVSKGYNDGGVSSNECDPSSNAIEREIVVTY